MYQTVTIHTADGKVITGNHFPVESPRGWIVYLHMMPATKASYIPTASYFQEKGFAGLAIDFRGHGTSEGGPEGYAEFSDREHQASYNDVAAAVNFAEEQGAPINSISLIGASIGANLALKYCVENSDIKSVVLLSPGLNYRGVTTKDLVTKLLPGQRVLFVGSEDDNYSVEHIEELYGLVPQGVYKEKQLFKDAGHGTTMIERHPELLGIISEFLEV